MLQKFVLPGKLLVAVGTAERSLPRMGTAVVHELLACGKGFATLRAGKLRRRQAVVVRAGVDSAHMMIQIPFAGQTLTALLTSRLDKKNLNN